VAASWWLVEKFRQVMHSDSVQKYTCIFTKHVTQKKKVWQDGTVTISSTLRAMLRDEKNVKIDEIILKPKEIMYNHPLS
jgi:hypothetical protein